MRVLPGGPPGRQANPTRKNREIHRLDVKHRAFGHRVEVAALGVDELGLQGDGVIRQNLAGAARGMVVVAPRFRILPIDAQCFIRAAIPDQISSNVEILISPTAPGTFDSAGLFNNPVIVNCCHWLSTPEG